jgi:hypothetical protein
MKLKTLGSKKKEIVILISGSIMMALIIFYLLWLVKNISEKADVVYGNPSNQGTFGESIDFEKYNNVVSKVFPEGVIEINQPTSTSQ